MQVFHYLFGLVNLPLIFSLINFDLTYTIKSTNPAYPGTVSFNFTQVYTSWRQDDSNEYYFEALNTFITSEHFSTHIDAPYHGSNTSWTVDQIPFERLVSIQGLIVDVAKKSSRIPNYQIAIEDLNEEVMKEANGFFVLLFYTGRSQFWPDQIAYAGGDTRDKLEFPGLSPQLASYLVDRYSEKLVGVGIDTLSIDPGSSKHFLAHRILFKSNKYVLENVAGLDRLLKQASKRRQTFFSFDVLPMKIEGGTGGPVRLVARLESNENTGGWFGCLILCFLLAAIGIGAKAIYDLHYNPDKTFA